MGTKLFNEKYTKSSTGRPARVMKTENSEFLYFLIPSMCPLDPPDSELKPACGSLENEMVHNSASDDAQEEIDISSESAEISD